MAGSYPVQQNIHSPVHLDGSLIFFTELIFILFQLLQCHALVCFNCSEKQQQSEELITCSVVISRMMNRTELSNTIFDIIYIVLIGTYNTLKQCIGSMFFLWFGWNGPFYVRWKHLSSTCVSLLPTDCCWRASSSSSSSFGVSLGGRIPFFLRISFHSVSSFGSCRGHTW